MKKSWLIYAMKEKFITDTLKENFMQQNASRGRQWACFGIVVKILCIVVKNPCRCIVGRNQKYLSLYRLGLLPCPLASGSLAWQQKGGQIFFARAQPLFLAVSPFATRVCSHSTISHTALSRLRAVLKGVLTLWTNSLATASMD